MIPGRWQALLPAVVLGLGLLGLARIQRQLAVPLDQPLSTLPNVLLEASGEDLPIGPEEQRVAGMDTYLMRIFQRADSSVAFSVYVGYYEQQARGRSIHSPKNCLPGAGWEPITSAQVWVRTGVGTDSALVNRYLLENKGRQAIVYYWYQGRGRLAWNEYRVKWELLRDKARWGRSEEALVRIVVPAQPGTSRADSVARAVAEVLVPRLTAVLPAGPS